MSAPSRLARRPGPAAPAEPLIARAALKWLMPLALLANLLPAQAQQYQLNGNLLAHAQQTFPLPLVNDYQPVDFNDMDDPRALSGRKIDLLASTPNGGEARVSVDAQFGVLKASAWASYPYGFDAQGRRVTDGYANASGQISFYDSVLVGGAGLAVGTPVRYELLVSIDGSLSSPSFEIGGFLSAYGLVNALIWDKTSRESVRLSWDASKQTTGLYRLGIDTLVGRELGLSAQLIVGASVDDYAQTGRSTWADFGHTAGFTLAPSVAGLNTIGASGQNYVSAVPEPAAWLLMVPGLLLVLRRRLKAED